MDIRTAGGMSGAPVFESENGNVIGIHYAGTEATIANAIPIDKNKLNDWLALHDKNKVKKNEKTK